LPTALRHHVADAVKLNDAERKAFMKDPTSFFAGLRARDDAETADHRESVIRHDLERELDGAWTKHYAGTPGGGQGQHEGKGSTTERKREAIREAFGAAKLAHRKTRDEAITDGVAAERRPAHRSDAAHYRWETLMDAESEHREAIANAVKGHEMTAKEYEQLHAKDYGPLEAFLKDPSGGEYVAGKPPARDDAEVLKSASEALMQVASSVARPGMMSWRGNEDSPQPERPANIVGITDEMGLTVKGKKKRKKERDEAKAVARASRLSPEDRFAAAKKMEGKYLKVIAPDTLKDAREESRDSAEEKRTRIREGLEQRVKNKPPMDPVRIARARGES
jgi:hypothetical protein